MKFWLTWNKSLKNGFQWDKGVGSTFLTLWCIMVLVECEVLGEVLVLDDGWNKCLGLYN